MCDGSNQFRSATRVALPYRLFLFVPSIFERDARRARKIVCLKRIDQEASGRRKKGTNDKTGKAYAAKKSGFVKASM